MLAQDSGHSPFAYGEVELTDQSGGAKAWCFQALSNDQGFNLLGCLPRASVRSAGAVGKTLEALALKAAQPRANGIAGAAKLPGGGADTVPGGVPHQGTAHSVFGIFGANHGTIPVGTHGFPPFMAFTPESVRTAHGSLGFPRCGRCRVVERRPTPQPPAVVPQPLDPGCAWAHSAHSGDVQLIKTFSPQKTPSLPSASSHPQNTPASPPPTSPLGQYVSGQFRHQRNEVFLQIL